MFRNAVMSFLGMEMNNLETKLMLDNLKSELNNFKMEVRLEMRMHKTAKQSNSTAVTDMLSSLNNDIRNDLASLKKRQDLLFHKQDQIQCTLSGGTPPKSRSEDFSFTIWFFSACLVIHFCTRP